MTKEEYARQREMEKHRVAKELRYTLAAVARNDMWRLLSHKSKRATGQLKEAGESASIHAETVLYRINDSPNFQRLLDDFKLLLQRLVGDQMSVEPLFQFAKGALDDISNNEELSSLVGEMQQLLPTIAENPTLVDDPTTQSRLESLSRRADIALLSLRENPNMKGAKEESHKVARAIKSEPNSIALLNDLKNLWRDIVSGKSGEAIDPDVLRSLRQMIVPLLVEHLNNVPLPTVSDQFSKY